MIFLQQVPQVNVQFVGENVKQMNTVDISVAVATESGLITPIVQNADQLGIIAISAKVRVSFLDVFVKFQRPQTALDVFCRNLRIKLKRINYNCTNFKEELLRKFSFKSFSFLTKS